MDNNSNKDDDFKRECDELIASDASVPLRWGTLVEVVMRHYGICPGAAHVQTRFLLVESETPGAQELYDFARSRA